MRILFFLVLSLSFIVPTYGASSFKLVKSKTCDGVSAALLPRERVFYNEAAGLLAFASDDASGCGIADFYSVFMSSRGQINGKETIVVSPVSAVSRKNCKNEMSEAKAIFFSAAIITTDSVILQNVGECKKMELKF